MASTSNYHHILENIFVAYSFTNQPNLNNINFNAWPLAPPNTHNIGFMINESLAILFDSGDCNCINGETRNFWILKYFPSPSILKARLVKNKNKENIRYDDYILCEVIADDNDIPNPIEVSTHLLEKDNEVFAFMLINKIWHLMPGHVISNDDTYIITSLQATHGACGALLFDRDMKGVGVGARISTHQKTDGVGVEKIYDVSRWTSLHHVIKEFQHVL